jgi:hypothetical protein
LSILCVGIHEGYVGHHIIWWGYRCTTPPHACVCGHL